MLRLVGLFAHLFDPVASESHSTEAEGDGREREGLSDFERRAIGDPMFSRDGLPRDEREMPRFANMVMPPYL